MRSVAGRGAPALRVDEHGLVWGADGTPRRYLRVGGLLLAGLGVGEQDDRAALWALIGASVPHRGELSILAENLPVDATAIIDALRAQFAPEPWTPALGALGERLLAWWHTRLRADGATESARRHVSRLVYHVIIAPPPPQQGFPDVGVLGRLEQATSACEQRLVALGAAPTRLDRAGVAAVLTRQGLSVDPAMGGVTVPRPPEGITALVVRDPRTGAERWMRHVYLVTPPPETSPGWLEQVIAWEEPHTVFVTLRGLKKRRERKRQEWRLRLLASTTKATDVEAGIAARDAREQATRLYSAQHSIVKAGVYVRVEGATRAEVDARAARFLTMLKDDLAAEPGYAWLHQAPLWRSIVLGRDVARSTYRWDSETWGNALPLLRYSPGTEIGSATGSDPLVARDEVLRSAPGPQTGIPLGTTDVAGELFTLALDHPSLYNRVLCLLGPTGRGKSTLLGKLILWMLLRGEMATVVDAVGGLGPLCALAGGAIVRLGGPHSATLNVWSGSHQSAEDLAERVKFVTTALDLLLGGLTPDERPLLYEGVTQVYDQAPDGQTPVMSDLATWLRRQIDNTALYEAGQLDPQDRRLYRSLLWKLKPYVKGGMHARLTDGPDSLDVTTPPLLVLDTEPLAEEPSVRDFALFTALNVVQRRRRVARARSQAGGRSTADHLTALEEAWSLLANADAREYIARTARTERRRGSVVAFVSQQVKDMTEIAEAETFFSQASIKFLHAIEDNGQQTEGNPRVWLANKLNLAAHEVDAAKAMVGVKNAYHPAFVIRRDRRSPRDLHGIARIELSEEEAILLQTDPDEARVREWWVEKHGGDVAAGIFAYADALREQARQARVAHPAQGGAA